MRLIFAGTPEVAVPAMRALHASSHEIVAVLTRADAKKGRGRHLVPSPVRVAAEELGIPVITQRPRSEGFNELISSLNADVAAVVAYGEILPKDVLDLVEHGWINLHFSLLPAWRGAAPVQRAIMGGDQVTGAATFRIEEGLDTGPVYGTMTETIRPRDTSGMLLDRLAQAGSGLLVATIDAIADGTITPVEQDTEGVSHAAKIQVSDAEVDWTRPCHIVDRTVRAVTPEPGAWTTLPDGARLGIQPFVSIPHGTELPTDLDPGALHITKKAVYVGTGSTPVQLGEVTPLGKKTMNAADWARGARLEPDTKLGMKHENQPAKDTK